MTPDRIKALESYSDDELLQEIERRRSETQRRLNRLSAATSGTPKYTAKSDAKARYWAEWKVYKASHPTATVEQWQRARKRSKG